MVVVADASVVVVVVVAGIVVDVSIGKEVVTAGTIGETVVVVVVTAVVVVVGRVAIQYRSYISRARDWYDFARIA